MQEQNPKPIGVDVIVKRAFHYWNKTLVFQLVFSLIYLSILIGVYYYFSSHYGILQQYLDAYSIAGEGFEAYQKEIQKIVENPNYLKFYYLILGTLVFLFPLNIGFYQIYRKMDLKESIVLNDLFVGYSGLNFFKFTSFYLFWIIVFSYLGPTIILGFAWILITLFSGPLMFFNNKRIFETLDLNFKALRNFFGLIFVSILVAILFKFITILTIFLLPLTFPFSNAMIYTLYQHIFKENK